MADGCDSAERALRVFVADTAGCGWVELTSGHHEAVRLAAADLQRAQRARSRLRAENSLHGQHDVAVILDVRVAIADDFPSARAHLGMRADHSTLHYAGTIDGLAGLIGDIFVADVADGVTLIPVDTGLDVRGLACAVLARLSRRLPVAA
jgi:hypothetical protein